MAPFSRAFARWGMLRVASGTLGLAIALMVAGYLYALSSSSATTEAVGVVVAVVAIAGVGLLYAWRLGAGGLVE